MIKLDVVFFCMILKDIDLAMSFKNMLDAARLARYFAKLIARPTYFLYHAQAIQSAYHMGWYSLAESPWFMYTVRHCDRTVGAMVYIDKARREESVKLSSTILHNQIRSTSV